MRLNKAIFYFLFFGLVRGGVGGWVGGWVGGGGGEFVNMHLFYTVPKKWNVNSVPAHIIVQVVVLIHPRTGVVA